MTVRPASGFYFLSFLYKYRRFAYANTRPEITCNYTHRNRENTGFTVRIVTFLAFSLPGRNVAKKIKGGFFNIPEFLTFLTSVGNIEAIAVYSRPWSKNVNNSGIMLLECRRNDNSRYYIISIIMQRNKWRSNVVDTFLSWQNNLYRRHSNPFSRWSEAKVEDWWQNS